MAKQLLMSSSFWVLNKTIVKILGVETAFLLSNMVEAESVMADKEGWFYQTIETVEEITGLSRHSQNKALKEMIKLEIVEQANRGIPMKRYFKINYEKLSKLLCENSATKYVKNSQTSVREIDKLDCEKSATNKEHTINKVNKESNNKELLQGCGSSPETLNKLEIDENFKTIVQAYQQEGFGSMTTITAQLIDELLKEYSTEWILEAMKVAVESNKRTLKYVKGVLKNWKADGGMKTGGGANGNSANRGNGSTGQGSTGHYEKLDLSHIGYKGDSEDKYIDDDDLI